MEYKYKGETYSIVLDDDGKVACYQLEQPIICDTPDEVKAEIRSRVKQQEEKPSFSVLIKLHGTYIKGNTKFTYAGRSRLWVTYTIDGKSKRVTIWEDAVILDTPENIDLVNQIEKKESEIERLKDEVIELEDKLVKR